MPGSQARSSRHYIEYSGEKAKLAPNTALVIRRGREHEIVSQDASGLEHGGIVESI